MCFQNVDSRFTCILSISGSCDLWFVIWSWCCGDTTVFNFWIKHRLHLLVMTRHCRLTSVNGPQILSKVWISGAKSKIWDGTIPKAHLTIQSAITQVSQHNRHWRLVWLMVMRQGRGPRGNRMNESIMRLGHCGWHTCNHTLSKVTSSRRECVGAMIDI